MTIYWIGRPGQLQQLPYPGRGYTRTGDLNQHVFQPINSGYAVDSGTWPARTWGMDFTYLSKAEVAVLRSVYTGALGPGPYVFFDPNTDNWLEPNQAAGSNVTFDSAGFLTLDQTGVQTLSSTTAQAWMGTQSLQWTIQANPTIADLIYHPQRPSNPTEGVTLNRKFAFPGSQSLTFWAYVMLGPVTATALTSSSPPAYARPAYGLGRGRGASTSGVSGKSRDGLAQPARGYGAVGPTTTNGSSVITARVHVECYDASHNLLSSIVGSYAAPSAASWTRFTISGTTPAGTAFISPRIAADPTTVVNQTSLYVGHSRLAYGADDATWTPGESTPLVAMTKFDENVPIVPFKAGSVEFVELGGL